MEKVKQVFEKTRALLEHFQKQGIPGYDLLVYQHGQPILRWHYGYSDYEQRFSVNGTERYNLYSCSKPITCTAALQLLEKGLFRLEDALCDYLPEFGRMTVKTENGLQPAKNLIKIQELFCMTAGFTYDLYSPSLMKARKDTNGRCPTREVMKYLAQEPLLFEPSTSWNYSLCHDVLAALVEVVSGEAFESYVQKHIFQPLGMTSCTYLPTAQDEESLCAQYRYDEATGSYHSDRQNVYRLGGEYASGGAGCVSTVDDYMRFLEALRKDELFEKRETLERMTRNYLTPAMEQPYMYSARYGYGLGVRCPKAGGGTDFGWGGAAGAVLGVDRDAGISIYYAQHVLSAPNGTGKIEVIRCVCEDLA